MAKRKTPAIDVARDRELRAIVEEQPGDASAIMVYADFLEEQGEADRARFLRMQAELRALRVSHPKLLERGRALHELGKALPADWVGAVTHPKLANTVWKGRDDDGSLVWRFLPSGMINYTQPSGTFENGRWQQVGITVAMDTNAHYADYFGVIIDDTIRGNAQNIVDHTWKWKVKRTDDPAVVAVPGNVNHHIYDDHVRARLERVKKRKAAKKPPAKAKPRSKPLARKTPLRRKRQK